MQWRKKFVGLLPKLLHVITINLCQATFSHSYTNSQPNENTQIFLLVFKLERKAGNTKTSLQLSPVRHSDSIVETLTSTMLQARLLIATFVTFGSGCWPGVGRHSTLSSLWDLCVKAVCADACKDLKLCQQCHALVSVLDAVCALPSCSHPFMQYKYYYYTCYITGM